MTTSYLLKLSAAVSLAALTLGPGAAVPAHAQETTAPRTVKLPAPSSTGKVPFEQALRTRTMLRSPSPAPLTLAEVGQLLWAAEGVIDERGRRTVPSASGLDPLELVLVAGNVTGLPAGVYRYRPEGHELTRIVEGDQRPAVGAAFQLGEHQGAPVIVFVLGVEGRIAERLGQWAPRFVAFQAGAATQNLMLEATALGLASGLAVGPSDPRQATVLGTAPGETVLAVFTAARQ